MDQIPGPVPPGANPTDKTPAEWGLNALRIKAHKGTDLRHPEKTPPPSCYGLAKGQVDIALGVGREPEPLVREGAGGD